MPPAARTRPAARGPPAACRLPPAARARARERFECLPPAASRRCGCGMWRRLVTRVTRATRVTRVTRATRATRRRRIPQPGCDAIRSRSRDQRLGRSETRTIRDSDQRLGRSETRTRAAMRDPQIAHAGCVWLCAGDERPALTHTQPRVRACLAAHSQRL